MGVTDRACSKISVIAKINFKKATYIWREEKLYSIQRAFQGQSSDQKYCQHHIGKG